MLAEKRNPKWILEEPILTLELYVKNPKSRTSKKIIKGSKLPEELKQLWKSLGGSRSCNFRNINGVCQKMQNFICLDPDCKTKGQHGRPNGNHLDKEVWDEFYDKPEALKKACQSIRAKMKEDALKSSEKIENDGVSALKGESIEQRSYRRKRDLRLRQAALDDSGGVCAVCDVNYSKVLGGKGIRVLQVHHKRQLSQLTAPQLNTPDDLAVVCANCHALIHLNPKKAMPINSLRLMLSK